MMNESKTNDRVVYFDYLRVFATISVIVLHIVAKHWYDSEISGYEWNILSIINGMTRWGVPIFLMISGALFLNRNIPTKTLFKKYILRMVLAFFAWSILYGFYEMIYDYYRSPLYIIRGYYHMWFILMIIGIYMCMPIIKPIVKSDSLIKYYLILSSIFGILLPWILTLIGEYGSGMTLEFNNEVKTSLNNIDVKVVTGYMFYFVLGFYVSKKEFTRKQRYIIYVLGIAGYLLTMLLEFTTTAKMPEHCGLYYGAFNPNVFFETIAVFVWFKHCRFNKSKLNNIVKKLSKYSFGAYLVHALIIEILQRSCGFDTRFFNEPLIGIPINTVVVFVLSFLISALLNRIPVINKYFV